MKEKIFLKQLGDYFDVYLPNVRRASSNTIAAYGYSFSIFFEFLYEVKGIPHSSATYKLLTPALFDEFILWMTNARKYSATSVRQRMTAISSFLKYASQRKMAALKPYTSVLAVERPTAPQEEFPYFTIDEIKIIVYLTADVSKVLYKKGESENLMSYNAILSNEAFEVLAEIIVNESNPNYWRDRFNNLSHREDSILRGCLKELRETGMISVGWADNYPYIIQVLKDGYLYEQYMDEMKIEEESLMPQFEKELYALLERTKNIDSPINAAPIGTDINEYNRPSEEWINDVEIFYSRYLTDHPLGQRIKTILFHRKLSAYTELVSCLNSVSKDRDYINKMNRTIEDPISHKASKLFPEYDVFLSHANKDKADIVEALNASLERLGINIFYDRKALEWGDTWKDRIIDGIHKAEFAIIVISENFFDREWTEKELNGFLTRQNADGQKLVLPIVHNITNQDLRNKYPSVADIQAIDSKDYTCDQIALLFARQLIKRLKYRN